jgi:NB-ARC domain
MKEKLILTALAGELERFSGQLRSTDNDATAGTTGLQDWEAVSLIQDLGPRKPNPKLPCFMMGAITRNGDFFSRGTILEQLDEALSPPQDLTFSSEPRLRKHAVLWGTPGLGKTTIAAEFAFSSKEKFDAVFWIRADEPSKLDEGNQELHRSLPETNDSADFSKIATYLELEDPSEPHDPVVSRELASGWLTSPKKFLHQDGDVVGQEEANWLLIFDNADKPDVLLDYWPTSSNGSVLVTSRDPLSKVKPSIASISINIPLLQEEEAAEMLRRISRVNQDHKAALEIAQKLEGLPLAIAQMAAIIQYQYLSYAEFLERYEDDRDRKRLHSLKAGGTQKARGTVSTIWFVDKVGPTPRVLLDVCAVLDPDSIQERIFITGLSNPSRLEAFPADNFEYSEARADLIKRSLITRNAERRQFRIHRLLQESVFNEMSQERLGVIFTVALELISSIWGVTNLVRRHDTSLGKSREGLFPHVLALKTVYEKRVDLQHRENALQLGILLNEAAW